MSDVSLAEGGSGDGDVQDRSVALAGRLSINEAEAIRDDLRRALAACRRLTVDTSGLETVDSAGLQLLISARRSAERAGKTFRLAGPPQGAFRAALMAAGFCSAEDNGQPDLGQDVFWWGRS